MFQKRQTKNPHSGRSELAGYPRAGGEGITTWAHHQDLGPEVIEELPVNTWERLERPPQELEGSQHPPGLYQPVPK